MGLYLTRFSWLWLGGKKKEQVSNGLDEGGLESESVKLKSIKGGGSRMALSTRIDKEYDAVLVASDGDCLSESDWSIGWLEPHTSGFHDDSFAVLVPCYRNECKEPSVHTVKNIPVPDGYSAGGRDYMEQWLSSLHTF